MADVTIKYRGSNIATLDATGTKTLNTSGKYCDSNIVVEYTKPESGGIEVIETPDSHGGTIVEINGTVSRAMNPWVMRGDAEKVYTLSYDKYIVADDGVTIPAYTTTSQTLKASETISPTVPYDYSNYNYIVAERCLTIPEYSITTKAKGRVEYSYSNAFYELVDYPANTISALIDGKKLASRSYSLFAAGNNSGLIYWTSGTAITRYTSAAYGTAQTVTAPTSSASAITIKTPALIVRGHATYFSSTYMNALTDIRYQYVIEVYRAPKNSMSFDGWGMYNMSLHCIDCAQSATHTLS
jgi:hypothetical protein